MKAFENRMLTRIFGTKGAELTGGWRKCYNDDLRNFHSSPNIVIMIKSWRSDGRLMLKVWKRKERTQIW
jgi:hypothetical protein